MSTEPNAPAITSNPRGVPPQNLLTALISRKRWQILAQMAPGDLFTVMDLAKRVGDTPASVSKHLALLRHAGITKFAIRGLHQIADQYRLRSEAREIDFGYMVMRLPDAK